ncbi:hypothetical protein EVAR_3340_1 [Eumeta japonica]|uniref:Uncharacterized protein n=1 Tax=Eumeta variegata TaxID=151549 RepID=A0A4C1SRW7_EUMVA|nr:hypothetical protein EVAR_3340_1 [Eumeta japonica]
MNTVIDNPRSYHSSKQWVTSNARVTRRRHLTGVTSEAHPAPAPRRPRPAGADVCVFNQRAGERLNLLCKDEHAHGHVNSGRFLLTKTPPRTIY